MKRKIALAMVLAMTASMAQPVLAADSKTTLDVIISQYGTQTQTWWTQFEKDFEAENPDIDLNVEIVSWNDLYTKVNTLVANNNAPDILNIDVLADYVADDLLMPATEYASEDLQAKFFPAFWEASTIDDTVYALPILASCRALFYNKDILDEAGASVPTTWAEVQETAQKIKDKFGDDVYPWGIDMTTDEGQAAFSYYTWNNGGGFVDENGDWALNSDKNVEALNFAIGLVNDGYTNSDPANETRYDLQDMFGAGKVAMMIGPNNIPTYLSDGGYDINYDVTTIPANEGCDSVAMYSKMTPLKIRKLVQLPSVNSSTSSMMTNVTLITWYLKDSFLLLRQQQTFLQKMMILSHPGSISCRAATSTRQLRPNGQMLNRA